MSLVVPDRESRHVTGRKPVMTETRYDIATSAQIASVLGLGILVTLLIAIWLSNLLPEVEVVPVVTTTGDGGWEDGSPDESLNVESPDPETDDPSLSNDQDVSQLEEITEQMATLTDTAAALQNPTAFTDPSSGGNPGSADGTGGRPFGSGGGGRGGTKREQRWLVQFADKGDLKSYARQLDFFKIELGCAFPDGRVFYLSNMSSSPNLREARLSSDDQRLFMNWQGGERIKADIELLTKAGVQNAAEGTILHFYDPGTEQMLARLEQEYGGHQPQEIRRTYFQAKRSGSEYEFIVTSQKLK